MNNTTSLKVSKKLKEANFKKKIEYYWSVPKSGSLRAMNLIRLSYIPEDNQMYKFYPSPNIAELLDYFKKIEILKKERYYSVKAYPFDYVVDKSLVDAIAELWILFKKEKLI